MRQAVSEHRLVTLTGTGGCGKTRLALHAAADQLDAHPDGVWFAELAAVGHDRDIAQVVAGVFGLREEFGRPLIDTLAEQLRDGRRLARRRQLRAGPRTRRPDSSNRCLQRAPSCGSWRPAASRSASPARSRGACRRSTRRRPSPCSSSGPNRRGRASRPTPRRDAAIAQIAERLDGIPLAIELAAARVRMMHPTRIAAALDDRFRLLTGGSRTAMPRQQTLEASVAWSYELLDDDERALARRLSVLHGFTLDAAEAVGCDDDTDRFGVLDTLARLVDKSLDPRRPRPRRRPLPDARVGTPVPPDPARGLGRGRSGSRPALRLFPRSCRAAGPTAPAR